MPDPARLIGNPYTLDRYRFVRQAAFVPDLADAVARLETRDFDAADFDAVWSPSEPPNAPLRSFADPETRRSWVKEENLRVFSLWHPDFPGFEVDLFVEEPFDFGEVFRRRVEVELDGSTTFIVGLDDLVALKKASGRAQDLEDIEALQDLARGAAGDD
jgi:hypothetical protein